MIDVEKIENNYNRFVALCGKLGDKQEQVMSLVNYFEDRIATTPSDIGFGFFGSKEGGFVEYSLQVLQNFKNLRACFKLEEEIDNQTMIFVCLFHKIGVLGTKDAELIVQNDKGDNPYRWNNEAGYMAINHRSLFLLQQFGIELTPQEWQTIFYVGSKENQIVESKLLKLLQTAIKFVDNR